MINQLSKFHLTGTVAIIDKIMYKNMKRIRYPEVKLSQTSWPVSVKVMTRMQVF